MNIKKLEELRKGFSTGRFDIKHDRAARIPYLDCGSYLDCENCVFKKVIASVNNDGTTRLVCKLSLHDLTEEMEELKNKYPEVMI